MKITKHILIIAALCFALSMKSQPAQAGAWPGNTISSGFGVQAKPERTGPDELERIRDAGFSYVRYDMRWGDVEKEHGVYDWDFFDRFIGDMRTYHLKSVIILNGPNSVYTQNVDVPPGQAFGASSVAAAPTKPEDVHAFAAFAVAAVERYGTKDIIWEIWNEPDMLAFWPPKPDADVFSALATRTCHAIRNVAPHAVIVGPAIARLPDLGDFFHEHFFRVFMQSPVIGCLDAISVHPYRHKDQPPESVIADYSSKVRPFIASYTPKGQKPLPIIDGEWGYTSSDVTPEQQAAYMLRIHLANLLAGVPLTILYEWKDSANMSDEREMHYGLLDSDGQNKGAAEVIGAILPRIKDAVIVRQLPLPSPDCYVVLIRQPGGKYQLLAWIGRKRLESGMVLQVKNGARNSGSSYALSLQPQIIDISSSSPQVTVAEKPSTP